ncbi:hypothetical protein PFY12_12895 [Chryseobacterium camelliae]|uniref:Uncharacterized protein n=1 Tax=Chryseobacterium camelliae TaxID=1265445 RepID=A0ABY7QJW3_9FLAO|nr:hypothetical protein [Chryseobacterium camelliae]WBV59932.1 hypothetical protein PFY12_12895 [Chryseobacterium camelliae]
MTENISANKVLFRYLGGLDEKDLKFIEEQFNILGIDFKHISHNGQIKNSLTDFSLEAFYALSISSSFLRETIQHIGKNVVWESLKAIFIYTRNKLKNQEYSQITKDDVVKKPIKFGINAILDENTSYNFELRGELSDELIDKSLDKMLEFLKEQKLNEKYEHTSYVRFSSKNEEWETESLQEYILKKTKK